MLTHSHKLLLLLSNLLVRIILLHWVFIDKNVLF